MGQKAERVLRLFVIASLACRLGASVSELGSESRGEFVSADVISPIQRFYSDGLVHVRAGRLTGNIVPHVFQGGFVVVRADETSRALDVVQCEGQARAQHAGATAQLYDVVRLLTLFEGRSGGGKRQVEGLMITRRNLVRHVAEPSSLNEILQEHFSRGPGLARSGGTLLQVPNGERLGWRTQLVFLLGPPVRYLVAFPIEFIAHAATLTFIFPINLHLFPAALRRGKRQDGI
mmetsp:Transcript_62438/g.92789  ORF Transcript_62438/g.92789 Transcript_62438/m.92789 type:complete len:233 (-) Transcript_62438:37-735(-)